MDSRIPVVLVSGLPGSGKDVIARRMVEATRDVATWVTLNLTDPPLEMIATVDERRMKSAMLQAAKTKKVHVC